MGKRKGWEPGKCRVKAEVISPEGGCFNWEIPMADPEVGLAIATLLNNAATEERVLVKSLLRAEKRRVKKEN